MNDAVINVDVDPSGGNQETVNVVSVGTAGRGRHRHRRSRRRSRRRTSRAPDREHSGSGRRPHRRHRRRPARPAAASGSGSGNGLRARGRPDRRSTASATSRRATAGRNWSATTQILPNMTATHSVPQIRTSLLPTSAMGGDGSDLPRLADAELPRRHRRLDAERHRADRDGGADERSAEPAVRSAGQDPDRGRQHERQHERPLHPGDRRRLEHVGQHHPPRAVLLQLRLRSRRACSYLDPANPANQCELRAGFVSSTDAGATWSDPLYLASMGCRISSVPARG